MRDAISQRLYRLSSRAWVKPALLAVGAVGIGAMVAWGASWMVLAVAVLVAVMSSRLEYRIAAAFVLVYFPFSPGSIGPIPNVLVSEILVPAAFPVLLIIRASRGLPLQPREARRYGIAAGVLVSVTALHFVTGPVFNAVSGQATLGSSGLRPFLDLFANILLFYVAMWAFDWLPKTKDAWARTLSALLVVALALTVLRLVTVGLGADTPLLTGVFDYGGQTRLANGAAVFRIGGLAEAATLGLACVAALWTMRSLNPRIALAALVWLLGCVGLSGGRSLALGVAGAVIAYLLGPARGRRLRIMISGAIVLGLVIYAAIFYGYGTQIVRIISLQGGFEQQDPARAEIVRVLWSSFLANPLIGKGIGVATEGLSDAFVAAQVIAGGHSSYMSLLGNFGLAGVFFIGVFLFDPLVRSLLGTRRAADNEIHSLVQGLMTFVLVHHTIRAFEYVAGGSGYRDPTLFLVTAMFVIAIAAGVRQDQQST